MQQPSSEEMRPEVTESSAGVAPPGPEVYDLIALRAYEIYQQRGGAGGDELGDWFRAEAEVLASRGRRASGEADGETAAASSA
jgi:Protein of unknown function (DUF2934)